MSEMTCNFDEKNPSGTDVGLITFFGIITAIVFLVICIAGTAWYKSQEKAHRAAARYGQIDADLRLYREEQSAKMGRFGWHEGKKTASVSIDQAVAVMKQKYKEDCGCPE